MRRLWALLLIVLATMLGMPAFAADGDVCGTDNFESTNQGPKNPKWCVLLCDDVVTSEGSCADFSFATANLGGADAISFEVGTDNDCTAGTVTLATHWVTGGQHHYAGGTQTNSQLDIAGTGNTRIMLDGDDAPLAAIVSTDFTGVSGCNGGFDVLMIGYEERR